MMETITLTTHHGAHVLVIDGMAYGVEDVIPDMSGITAGELAIDRVASFLRDAEPELANALSAILAVYMGE